MCVVVLPSFIYICFVGFCFVFSCRGEYIGEEIIIYSRSPLSEPAFVFILFVFLCLFQMSGRIHRVVFLTLTLVLPSLNRNSCLRVLRCFVFVHFWVLHL